MDKNIEKDVKNACDDMSLQELTEYMEHIDMPSVSDESKDRIKALVAKKLDTEKMNTNVKQITGIKTQNNINKSRRRQDRIAKNRGAKRTFRFATVAAVAVLTITATFMMNTESVMAALAKMFGFIPGVGVVEVPSEENSEHSQLVEGDSAENNQTTGWYILEGARCSKSDENVTVEIQNANIVNDVLSVNYTVDLLNISISDLEKLSLNLSEDSFKDYADLYTNAGYETYFKIEASANTLTPLSSVELEGDKLSILDREVLSGETLEGAKLICISERYKVDASVIETAPTGNLTVGNLKVDFAMKDLLAYVADESARQNGAICTVDGIKLLCVPTWEGEKLFLDFYVMESGAYDRVLGFGMGYWPELTVNHQRIEGYADESYVFETENTGCLGRRIYYDLSDVEGEIATVDVYLEGIMAAQSDEIAVLDTTKLDMSTEEIHFSQTVNMGETNLEFSGLTKYVDEDEFLYSEYGNALVRYTATDSSGDAEFAGFEGISINGIEHGIWAEGDGELYLKLPCEFDEIKKIEFEGAQYFVYSGFTFTIEK